jgi:hypothetical protein
MNSLLEIGGIFGSFLNLKTNLTGNSGYQSFYRRRLVAGLLTKAMDCRSA